MNICPECITRHEPRCKVTERPKLRLVGLDGNVFVIIGSVCAALKKAGLKEKASKIREMAMKSECSGERVSYDEVLLLASEVTQDPEE